MRENNPEPGDLHEIFDTGKGDPGKPLQNLWRSFLIRGIVAAAIGLVALLWPTDSVSLLLRFVGLLILLDGAIALMGIRKSGRLESVSGIVMLVIGVALLILPTTSARLAFLLIGLWAVVRAIGYFAMWWQNPQIGPERDAARNAGIVTLVVGVALVLWPGTGIVTIGWAIAFAALVIAAIMFFLAFRVRQVRQRISD